MENIDYKNSRLTKYYFSSHLYEIATNLLLTSSILGILFAFAPIAVALMFVLYAFIAIMISIFIVVFTLGLVFADHSHPFYQALHTIWSTFDMFTLDKIVVIQQQASPILIGISGGLLVVTFIFTLAYKGRYNKSKPIGFMIASLVLILITVLVFIISKGVK